MKLDWNRLSPVGVDGYVVWRSFALGIFFSAVWSLGFVLRYIQAFWRLFQWDDQGVLLVPGAQMEPFLWLLGNGLMGYGLVFLGALALVVYNYRTHSLGSKSIYLMKRLPKPWELHRRCWGIPVLVMAAEALAVGATLGLYALIYFLATPQGCLP